MEINLNVEKEDIAVIKKTIAGKELPVELQEIIKQVALFKTKSERKSKVKLYNPNCEFKQGDLIYKEYNSKIPIGAKKFVELERGVVLKVEEVRSRNGFEQIKLSYDGTSIFRKYIQYLDRQKIDLLLPHKKIKHCEKAEYITDDLDPRTKNEPLVKRDFKVLEKKIVSFLQRNNDIAFVNNKVLLYDNLKEISSDVFERIRQFLTDNKQSVSTEFLVENFLKIKPDTDEFTAYCFSVNYKMSSDYKIDFQQTSKNGWGKWNLISVVYHLKKDSLLSHPNPLISTAQISNDEELKNKKKSIINNFFDNDMTKCILSQREVTAGAIRVKSLQFDFGNELEFEIIDSKTKKTHTLYYYKDVELLVGFKDIFKNIKALQGMSINFKKDEEGKIYFTIKELKKGTVADEIVYDSKKKAFNTTYKKIASQVFVNKTIFLETDVFSTLYEDFDAYLNIKTFNKLVHKIFINFGKKEKNYEIHAFRLYHILDLIYPTPFDTVIEVLSGNSEFIPSEKLSGVFYLDSNAITNIEEDEIKRIEENKEEQDKKIAELKKEKSNEEEERLEAIRRKREERRIKRENEMRLKEEMRRKKEETEIARAKPRSSISFGRKKEEPVFAEPISIERKTKIKEPAKKQSPIKEDIEKTPKSKKRVEPSVNEDKIDIEDIKKDIKLEELKEQVLSKKKKGKKEKKKEVAYKDDGAFSGVFASILDDAVSKKDKK